MKHRKNASKMAALGAAVALTAAACGSEDADTIADEAAAVTTEAVVDAEEADDDAIEEGQDATDEEGAIEEGAMEEGAMEEGAMEEGAALEPSGELCEAVPADGEGSFAGMTDDPAATAASNNPSLSTLVAAVTAADLVDTLNSDGPFTIFAPANLAFEAFTQEELDAMLADKETLKSLLTLHVVAGEKLSSVELAEMDSVTTVNGADITIEATEDGAIVVNGQAAVGCADVATANATVHIIDSVLMPSTDTAAEGDVIEEGTLGGGAETEQDG